MFIYLFFKCFDFVQGRVFVLYPKKRRNHKTKQTPNEHKKKKIKKVLIFWSSLRYSSHTSTFIDLTLLCSKEFLLKRLTQIHRFGHIHKNRMIKNRFTRPVYGQLVMDLKIAEEKNAISLPDSKSLKIEVIHEQI